MERSVSSKWDYPPNLTEALRHGGNTDSQFHDQYKQRREERLVKEDTDFQHRAPGPYVLRGLGSDHCDAVQHGASLGVLRPCQTEHSQSDL